MKCRICAVVVALLGGAVLTAAAGQQQHLGPPPDLEQLRVHDLMPSATHEALRRKALEAHLAGRYVDAARDWVALLRAYPGDPTALYNLGCCYARLGAAERAAELVAAAWDAGFSDLEQLRRDPDFAGVRSSAPFVALVRRLERQQQARQAQAGEPFTVPVTVATQVRVVAAEGAEDDPRLVVALHGWGDTAAGFAGLFKRAGAPQPFMLIVPEGPYATPGARAVGHSWFETAPDGRRALPASLRDTEDYVLRAMAAVRQRDGVSDRRAVVVGFSQGAYLALALALDHPEAFSGVVAIGGWLEPERLTVAALQRARGRVRVLLCGSPEDRAVPLAEAEAVATALADNGVGVHLVRYSGGHVVPPELVRRVARWIEAEEATASPEDEQ